MVNKIENIDANDAFKQIGKKISDKRKSLRKKFPGISKKLNISVTFLKYIEEGKIDKIPDHIPAKGFVKTYAKLLNVNIEYELDILEQDIHTIDKSLKSVRSDRTRPPKAEFFVIILILFCIIFVFLLIDFNNSKKNKNYESIYGLQKEINIISEKVKSPEKKSLET
tara:strand:+ start:85 stop:585 length:501 start_codon:yes stop_codon:yes gene_type:complete